MNKRLNNLISAVVCVFAILFNFSASAQQALSKSLIQQYAKTTEQLTPLIEADPKIENQLTKAMMQGKTEMLRVIKSLTIYPEIKSTVTNSGFNNVDQYLDTSLRIMGAIINSQSQQLPNGMNIDELIGKMENQISAMKKQGLPKELLSTMGAGINEQLNSMKSMQKIVKNASEADVKFVKANLAWVMQMLPSFDSNHD